MWQIEDAPANAALVIKTPRSGQTLFFSYPARPTAGGNEYFSFSQAIGESRGGGQAKDGMFRGAASVLHIRPNAEVIGPMRAEFLLWLVQNPYKPYVPPTHHTFEIDSARAATLAVWLVSTAEGFTFEGLPNDRAKVTVKWGVKNRLKKMLDTMHTID